MDELTAKTMELVHVWDRYYYHTAATKDIMQEIRVLGKEILELSEGVPNEPVD